MKAVQIFEKYATEEQKPRMRELQSLFTETMLCKNDEGMKLIEMDEQMPYAAEALAKWNDPIVYITGRLESIKDITMDQLRLFGFPLDNSDLYMFKEEDWAKGHLREARRRILDEILNKHQVLRVIDDFPGYFPVYKELEIPERIGLCYSTTYKHDDFISRGATRVVDNWKKLIK